MGTCGELLEEQLKRLHHCTTMTNVLLVGEIAESGLCATKIME